MEYETECVRVRQCRPLQAGPTKHGDKFVNALRDNPEGLRSYFERFKRDLSACGNARVPVLFILEGDQMNVARHYCITRLGGDANRLPVAVKASGHADALAAGADDSLSGLLQVLAYLRDTYAPNVSLSPVQKIHAGPIVRSKRNSADDLLTESQEAQVKKDVAFWRSTGVKWDALSVNWGPSGGMHFPSEAVFRNTVRLHGSIARGLGIWCINWRVTVSEADLRSRKSPATWKNNVPHLILTNLAFMESQGFTAVCFEFDKKKAEPADLGPFGEAMHSYYEKARSERTID